jgi:single-stranded-DNA-specific exonuclease
MKTWIEPQPVEVLKDLQAAIGGHPLVGEVLTRRGFRDPQAAETFLDPDRYQPASPFDLAGTPAAVQRLEKAIHGGETICVWGDFDVDGQTATTVLVSALKGLGAKVVFHIPVRASESHGVNLPVLERLIQDGADLVLTCDTGISAHAAVDYANSQGVDVIISDHHDPPPKLPDAYALINPKLLPDDPVPGALALAALPGVGVSFQLAKALYERAGRTEEIDSCLDLVALGIVADLAQLVDDTRYLLQRGLQVLRRTERLGLQALLSSAEIDPAHLSEEHIAFGLAPRLNALGRLSDANTAVELLTTTDLGRARFLANQLEKLNARRKLLTDQVFQACQAQIERDPALLEQAALTLSHPAWPAGVIGIVASRLVEQTNRPVILIATPEGELGRGSARSIEGCNITAAIAAQSDILANYGGHPMAAGLAIDPQDIPAFRRGLSRAVEEQIGTARVEPTMSIDAYLPLSVLTPAVVADLERLAPFGPGNPALTLACKDVSLKSHTTVGRTGEHLQVIVEDREGESTKVIWWGGGGMLLPEGRFDLAYVARSSNFLGQPGVQVEWVDARLMEAPVEIRTHKPEIAVVDYRWEQHPLSSLKALVAQEGAQVWAEAEAKEKLAALGIRSLDRSGLSPSSTLAIWTTPSGRAELDLVLERLSPERVYVFAVDPANGDLKRFLERLAGLVRHVIRRRNGLVNLDELAAATAQTRASVHAGMDWLCAQGDVKILADDGTELKLDGGDKGSIYSSDKAAQQLKALLQESAAFRSYFRRAEADILINPTDD